MTSIQWYFHYMEVIKERNRAREESGAALGTITNYIELLVKAINPELATALQEAKEARKAAEELPEEKFEDIYGDIDAHTPDVIMVETKTRKGGITLPKYHRKEPGIVMPEGDKNELSN